MALNFLKRELNLDGQLVLTLMGASAMYASCLTYFAMKPSNWPYKSVLVAIESSLLLGLFGMTAKLFHNNGRTPRDNHNDDKQQ